MTNKPDTALQMNTLAMIFSSDQIAKNIHKDKQSAQAAITTLIDKFGALFKDNSENK
jgi:hypothetical protein